MMSVFFGNLKCLITHEQILDLVIPKDLSTAAGSKVTYDGLGYASRRVKE